MDPLWASIIITGGGPGFVTSCWKYFVDANFETENFEWKIYVPGGDWTHVPLTEWYTYTWGVCLNLSTTGTLVQTAHRNHIYRVFRYLRPPSTAKLGIGTYQNYILSWPYINSKLPWKVSWLYRYWPTSGLMFYVSRSSTFSWTISPCIFWVTFPKCP